MFNRQLKAEDAKSLMESVWGAEAKPVVESKETKGKSKEKVVTEDKDELTCPLCKSHLKEAVSDEALLEHASEMFNLFEQVEENLNESEDSEDSEDESEETDEDESEEDSDEDSDDEEDEESDEDEE